MTYPCLKPKTPQSFDDWFEQIDKVVSVTNKDPYKLALAKSQGSFSRMIISILPSMGRNKIKEWLHYNFGSLATKQHVASMLIDQQEQPTETQEEYVQRLSDLLLKSSGSLPHQAKNLAHVTHFICNLLNQKLQHYVLGKNLTSVVYLRYLGLDEGITHLYKFRQAYMLAVLNTKEAHSKQSKESMV